MAPWSNASAIAREQTKLYLQLQQHAATFFAQAEADADLPQLAKAEFDAFLDCDSLA